MNRPVPLPQAVASVLHLIEAPGRILVGVSGGADSVALLRCLHAQRDACGPEIVVGHLNHLLRGAAADADAAWVQALCERLQVPVHIQRLDIAHEAQARGLGIEEAARGARYAFLQDLALKLQAPTIAVAHTADDQAETVLHHLIRGTGLSGLSGIPASRLLDSGHQLIRPLLTVRRAEVLRYLESLGQDHRDDATNADETLTRNRIRHTLLPLLTQQFNPGVVESLLRLSEQSRDLQQGVELHVARLFHVAVIVRSASECEIHCASLNGEPRHFVRELFVQLWRQQDWPRQAMGFAHWDHLADLVFGKLTAMHFPGGIQVRREKGMLWLRQTQKAPIVENPNAE